MKALAVIEGVYLDRGRQTEALDELNMEAVVLKMAMKNGGAEEIAKTIDDAGHMVMTLVIEARVRGRDEITSRTCDSGCYGPGASCGDGG